MLVLLLFCAYFLEEEISMIEDLAAGEIMALVERVAEVADEFLVAEGFRHEIVAF